MKNQLNTEIKRIGGYLKEVTTFFDESGQPISHIMNPLMVELRPRDIMQIFAGAFLIATPLSLTEEVWQLSKTLPIKQTIWLALLSIIIVSSFVYSNFYRFKLSGHVIEFVKRILAIYGISTFSVVLLLYLFDKLPYQHEPLVTIKRILIIGFPAIFGATITDYLK